MGLPSARSLVPNGLVGSLPSFSFTLTSLLSGVGRMTVVDEKMTIVIGFVRSQSSPASWEEEDFWGGDL